MPIYRYTLRGRRGKVLYYGQTKQPRKRAAQHRKAGKKGRMKVEGRSKTRRAAKAWERNSLDRYRRNHNGRNPPYNKTWDG